MGSPRTKLSVDTKPSKEAMILARRVIENWERQFTSNEFLVADVAEALDAAYKSGRLGVPLGT